MQVINNTTLTTLDTKLDTLSDKYKVVQTKLMKAKFEAMGFVVNSVLNAKVRKKSKEGFQRHVVRMSNPTLLSSIHKDCKLELVLTNSHDGTSGFKMQLGIYRLICANGLMVGSTFETINLRHVGNIEDKIEESVMRIVGQVGKLDKLITQMKAVTLTPIQQTEFIEKAIKLRYDTKSSTDVSFPIHRPEDNAYDVFTFFNRLQESLIRGGNVVRNDKNQLRVARPITSIVNSNLINTGLFTLAEQYITEALAA